MNPREPTADRLGAIYRCYFLDLWRKVVAVEVLDCRDDGAATEAARALLTTHNRDHPRYGGVELWDRERLIFTDAAPDGAAPDGAPRDARG